jgi:hypothetical protein
MGPREMPILIAIRGETEAPMNPVVVFVILAIASLVMLAARVKVKVGVQGGLSFHDLRAFAKTFDERTVQYFRTNYSGDPTQLEGAIRGLLPILRELAAAQPVPIDEDILRTLLVACVSRHRLAPRGKVEAALDSVTRSEAGAA